MPPTARNQNAIPFVIDGTSINGRDSSAVCESVHDVLLRHGALLWRHGKVRSDDDFGEIARDNLGTLIPYSFDTTPRTDLGGGVYTSTEHARWVTIHLHNECAYQRVAPLKLMFGCLVAPEVGGETLLADMRAVMDSIDPNIRDKVREKGVMYVRNYRPGVDIPWQKAFHTDKRDEVEQYCATRRIACEWRDDCLRTIHVAQGVAKHPYVEGEWWFNQVHRFHISSVEKRTRAALGAMYTDIEMPRNAFYGDGTSIQDSEVETVRQAFERSAILVKMQPGDLLILDNVRVAHGRLPYAGERRVLVAMAEPCEMGEPTASCSAYL